jgi:16S rRNA A1518/A1519 N6-dimethyltransferase RsmA/KsgA/DIM1 with predicted DNA glycosylase/AP lyase activity
LEIGCGSGNITQFLAEKAEKVLGIEIDTGFKDELEKLKKKHKNVEVVYSNLLDYDWFGYNKMISNIPFSMSEPIVQKLSNSAVNLAVLFVGENFKNALLSDSKIGIIARLFFYIRPVMKIDKSSFEPSPDVDSWLVKLARRKDREDYEEILVSLIRKKGKIKNAIIYSLLDSGKTKNQAREFIKNSGFGEDVLNKPISRVTGNFLLKLIEALKDAD